ncbi:MAG TPA: PAS domain S-box protein [Candidatus Kapabacteria bacterium]
MERNLVKRGLNRIILLPIVLSVLYAAVLVWQLSRMVSSNDWILHTTAVMELSSEAARHIQFQESALSHFDIVPNDRFLEEFHTEEQNVDSCFERLHALTIDNPPQTARLDSLMQTYWTWQSSARHSLSEAIAARNLDPSHQTVHIDSALLQRAAIATKLRKGFRDVIAAEQVLYSTRLEEFRSGTTLLVAIIALASLGLGLVVGLYARRQSQRFIEGFSQLVQETSDRRDLLATTLLSIDDAVIVTDVAGTITMMNTRALDLTGWRWPEARSRRLEVVLHVVKEEDRFVAGNAIETILSTHKPVRSTQRLLLLSRTGVEYPIEQTAAPVCNSDHDVVSIVIVFRDISDQRDSEHASELREREFRALIENAPDVIVRHDRELRITYANPAVTQVLGLEPRAMLGKTFGDLGIFEETFPEWQAAVRKVFESGNENTIELEYRTVRGLRTYHARIVPEIGYGETKEEFQSVISIARDITEMKNVERRLRESEQRFRGIVENNPDAFFLLRPIRAEKQNPKSPVTDFVIDYMNQQARELLTIAAPDMEGRRLSEALPGDRPKQFIEHYARILESGVSSSQEYKIETPYVKHAQWVRSQYIPMENLLAVLTSDITERMQTTIALERSEERYRRLVEHASEAIFSTDNEGRFTYANPYIRELGGYNEDDITQYHFTDLVVPEYRDRVKMHFHRQFLSRAPLSQIEAPFLRRAGGQQWLAITASLDIHADEIRGFDCIATDITDRRKMEQELQELRSDAT